MATKTPRYLKVLILGDAAVGKTCILNQYVTREFSAEYKVTIGSDFYPKEITVNDHKINLTIFDTAGQERFQSLGSSFYRSTQVCVLVYDITKGESFEHVDYWRTNFMKTMMLSESDPFPFLLLGNKCDLPNRVVQTSAAREYAMLHGNMKFFEVSAKTADGIESAFQEIITYALETSPKEPSLDLTKIQQLKKDDQPPPKKSCCN